jgi:hypothetical protein
MIFCAPFRAWGYTVVPTRAFAVVPKVTDVNNANVNMVFLRMESSV